MSQTELYILCPVNVNEVQNLQTLWLCLNEMGFSHGKGENKLIALDLIFHQKQMYGWK